MAWKSNTVSEMKSFINLIRIFFFDFDFLLERLLNAIADIKQNLALKYRKQNAGENAEEIDQQIERIYKHAIGECQTICMYTCVFRWRIVSVIWVGWLVDCLSDCRISKHIFF